MMSPKVRRVVYVTIYEIIAVTLVGTSLSLILGKPLFDTGGFAILSSLIAVIWNYIYTTGFEFWESRQAVRGRSVRRRVGHAVGFEGGLIVILTPTMAWWLDLSLVEAFLYDAGYALLFMVYTYLFNLAFDGVFGLPQSAR